MVIYRNQWSDTDTCASDTDPLDIRGEGDGSLHNNRHFLAPGTTLEPYRILRTLAYRASGAVYAVEHGQQPDTRMALLEVADAGKLNRRLQTRLMALRDLEHDYLPRYERLVKAHGKIFLPMELVAGHTLEEVLLQRQEPLSAQQVIDYAFQLCDVVGYLHNQQQPVIHGNINPATVRVMPNGLVKLMGLEAQIIDQMYPPLTPPVSSYKAPEQWAHAGQQADHLCDIYSLGATLFVLLTGRTPPSAVERLSDEAAGEDRLEALWSVYPDLSHYVTDVIRTAFALDREQRYMDAKAFQSALSTSSVMLYEYQAPSADVATHTLPRNADTRQDAPINGIGRLEETVQVTEAIQPAIDADTPPESNAASQRARTTDDRDFLQHLLVCGVVPQGASYQEIIDESLTQVLQGHSNRVYDVAWSPDGRVLASGSWDRTVLLWRVTDEAPVQGFEACRFEIYGVAWSPDNQVLTSVGWQNKVQLWQASNGARLRTLNGHSGSIYSIAWSPDGQMLASGSWDKTIRLWQMADNRLLHVLQGHKRVIYSVAWSPDSTLLASASADATVRVWRVADGTLLHTFQGHSGAIYSIAWSSDGALLASASADATVRVWRVADGTLLHTFQGHSGAIYSVAWSPDGQMLATGGKDCHIRLWHAADGVSVQALRGHGSRIRTLAWHNNGTMLASGSDDETVRLWHITPK